MKCAGFILCLAALTNWAALPASKQDTNHVRWVAESMEAMASIKIGMTRAALEKVFVTEGGLFTRTTRTYAYRNCPYFKVDVELEPNDANPGTQNDKVIKISKPYLDWAIGD